MSEHIYVTGPQVAANVPITVMIYVEDPGALVIQGYAQYGRYNPETGQIEWVWYAGDPAELQAGEWTTYVFNSPNYGYEGIYRLGLQFGVNEGDSFQGDVYVDSIDWTNP